MKRQVGKKHWKQRNWNSLSDVKKYLEETGEEVVSYYDGGCLKTDKSSYGLYDSRLVENGIIHEYT